MLMRVKLNHWQPRHLERLRISRFGHGLREYFSGPGRSCNRTLCLPPRRGTELVRVDLVKAGKMDFAAWGGSQFTAEACA
jgi:hypothetical protein